MHVYGTPFFIQAELPIDSEEPTTKWRRLMVAQDTGGAIIGPARADIYYGAGEPAGLISGRFKQPGQFTMLFPKSVDPFSRDDEDEEIPLPKPRPANIPQDEMAAARPEVVAAVTTAATGTPAAVPLPVARPEVKKPEAAKTAKTANVKPAEAKPEAKPAERSRLRPSPPTAPKPAAKKKPEPKKVSKKSAKPVEPAPPG